MKQLAVIVTAFLLITTFSTKVSAQDTPLQKAASAFTDAQALEVELMERPAAERSRNDCVRVIDAYQRVYLITPHTGYADNALVAVARLYEQISDSSAAIRTLAFLLS